MRMPESMLRVMNVVWENENISAKEIADTLKAMYGWNKNTTYTVINQCIKRGWIARTEPNFKCRALLTRGECQKDELNCLLNNVFAGSVSQLFSTLAASRNLSEEDISELEDLISKLK